MRIAQVAPLFGSVPPKYYGGTERVVSYLTEELVRQGHEVTLFASGDSVTKANLVAACRRSLRLNKHCMDQLAHQILMLQHAFQRAREFDIVHFRGLKQQQGKEQESKTKSLRARARSAS